MHVHDHRAPGHDGAMPPLPDGYRPLALPADRADEMRAVSRLAFAGTLDPAVEEIVPFTVPTDRLGAVEAPDGTLAGAHGSFAFTMPVPGGAMPCAGLTWVGVRPEQRRRGVLTAMIDHHLARCVERGEPVSALFAAETAIYGRFGYGCAADDVRLTLPRRAALRPVAGADALTVRLTHLDAEEHADLVDDLHRRAGAGRPGWMTRDSAALRRRMVVDPPAWRGGTEAMLLATVHDAAGAARGYATFARKEGWEPTGPAYTVRVREAHALDAAATHALWSFLLDLDLTTTVESPMLPADDPLLHLLVDPRPAGPRLADNLWVRLVDVPAALAARSYAADVDVVLDVRDDRLPANAGTWRVRAAAHGDVEVTRADGPGDVLLDVRELGAAYLGGRSLTAMARAGLVQVRDGYDVTAAAAAFGWPVAPVCSWVF